MNNLFNVVPARNGVDTFAGATDTTGNWDSVFVVLGGTVVLDMSNGQINRGSSSLNIATCPTGTTIHGKITRIQVTSAQVIAYRSLYA